MIRIRSSADARFVAKRLTQLSPREWKVVARQDLIEAERSFWSSQTPIGTIFGVGTIMGFAVGVIICYQVLFTSIHDSMAEFATLKAMGYSNAYFLRLVMMQSVYLALFGFVPAFFVCLGLFELLEKATGLPMVLNVCRVVWVLTLTVAMCLFSGLLALRKLLRADPASLF